jgi:hypothetical protein
VRTSSPPNGSIHRQEFRRIGDSLPAGRTLAKGREAFAELWEGDLRLQDQGWCGPTESHIMLNHRNPGIRPKERKDESISCSLE